MVVLVGLHTADDSVMIQLRNVKNIILDLFAERLLDSEVTTSSSSNQFFQNPDDRCYKTQNKDDLCHKIPEEKNT